MGTWPGRWYEGNYIVGDNEMMFHLADNHLLDTNMTKTKTRPVSINFSGNAGLFCGEWLSFGAPDLPADQRFSSLFHVSFQAVREGLYSSPNWKNTKDLFTKKLEKTNLIAKFVELKFVLKIQKKI